MSRLGAALRSIREFRASLRQSGERAFFGIVDFSYQHYAPGDALTSLADMSCMAIDAGVKHIDLALILDPDRPSARPQGFITDHNYTTYLDNPFPAYLCNLMVRSLRVLRDRQTFNSLLVSAVDSGATIWTGLSEHLHARFTFPSGHKRINRFHRKRGYIPMFACPRGYRRWAERFMAEHLSGKFVVCVNLRQSALTPNPAVIYRDAPLAESCAFFDQVALKYRDATFILMGGFTEWEHTVFDHPNVLPLRAHGFSLVHELALLNRADLFMGSSSGFATMATFCNKPYVITNVQHLFARYIGVLVGARHYPFGNENQILYWETETQNVLLNFFEELHARVPGKSAS